MNHQRRIFGSRGSNRLLPRSSAAASRIHRVYVLPNPLTPCCVCASIVPIAVLRDVQGWRRSSSLPGPQP
eukprot:5857376-Pyramimonas_sp.AAC.1